MDEKQRAMDRENKANKELMDRENKANKELLYERQKVLDAKLETLQ
jgi:hypothetical protein